VTVLSSAGTAARSSRSGSFDGCFRLFCSVALIAELCSVCDRVLGRLSAKLVRHANSSEAAIAAPRELFSAAGLEVVVCSDQAGRIINRLAVPKYNAALRFLDEGLASEADMDLTCKLGLGYPDGPIERVVRGGLANHYRISKALFEANGTPAYAPPRRAAVSFKRGSQEIGLLLRRRTKARLSRPESTRGKSRIVLSSKS
jgi:hypothetical protein